MLKPEDFMARNAVSISQRFYRSLLHLQVGWNRSESEVRVSLQSSWFDFRRDRHTAHYAKELVVEFLLSDFEGIEEPPCSNSLSCGGLDTPKVLPDTDIVSNPVVVKPANPLLADELAVGHKAVDAVMSKKSDEALHDILAFFPIGIASFAQKTEQQWEGNAFVGDAKGEYIDVELSELPVGAVHTQNQTLLNRKQRESNYSAIDIVANDGFKE